MKQTTAEKLAAAKQLESVYTELLARGPTAPYGICSNVYRLIGANERPLGTPMPLAYRLNTAIIATWPGRHRGRHYLDRQFPVAGPDEDGPFFWETPRRLELLRWARQRVVELIETYRAEVK